MTGSDRITTLVRWDELHSGVSSEFLRVRVSIPIQKPLRRIVKMQSKEGPISYKVGYERLPIYCFKCGTLGHLKRSCPLGQNSETDDNDPYGSWLRADSPLKKLSIKEKEKSQQLSKLWEEVQSERISKQKKDEEPKNSVEQAEELSESLLFIKVNDPVQAIVNVSGEKEKEPKTDGVQVQAPKEDQHRVLTKPTDNPKETGKGGHDNQVETLAIEYRNPAKNEKKWHRLERKNLENQPKEQTKLEIGKRGTPEDMDIDENPVSDKRPRDYLYSNVDGEEAVLAKEQGRRAQ
ncbi:unnamed protein product [Linum trigynum]|uniref:CCHC-type domain-containing protein n=1 Tax=Linum trigynum TaxID=586398 RepID=A0AAV2DDZ1_9ROSI